MLQRLKAALVVTALVTTSALMNTEAQAKGKGKAKGKEGHTVVIADADRGAVRTYWIDTYGRGNCPPGLAKKHNGCLPPGQAKKRYAIGHRLPVGIVVEPLPEVLGRRLRPTPAGYRYVVVDGDVLLLATATSLVVDAIANIFD
jgi:Ni/Co efflux regulator RcnB